MATVLRLPTADPDAAQVPDGPAPAPGGDRLAVDDWGRDEQLIRSILPLVRLRWQVSVGGDHHLPLEGGALLVTNLRRFSLSPIYVALALGSTTGRPVRFVGRPDTAPVGAALRRIGGLLADPDELAGALRHGELVVMAASATGHPRHAGVVDHSMVGAAVLAGVPVHPVASMSSSFGRVARALVAPALRPRRQRRGPLAEVELADLARRQLQRMLDELGGSRTGLPAIDRWGDS